MCKSLTVTVPLNCKHTQSEWLRAYNSVARRRAHMHEVNRNEQLVSKWIKRLGGQTNPNECTIMLFWICTPWLRSRHAVQLGRFFRSLKCLFLRAHTITLLTAHQCEKKNRIWWWHQKICISGRLNVIFLNGYKQAKILRYIVSLRQSMVRYAGTL